jgi:ABC-type Fe3+-hydroxamate transport system substrate-binding protein
MAIDGDRGSGGGMGEPAVALRRVPDDLGVPVSLPPTIRRVVSLVPSLTETMAACAPGLLVGATNWCTHPADLAVTRIGGTKNPDIAKIVALQPDVVLANEEENRLPDLDALRSAGQAVWVTRIRDLPEALTSLRRMITLACRRPKPAWLDAAQQAWGQPSVADCVVGNVAAVVPIWRRPWMVLGRDTFAGDLLARLGISNFYGGHEDRYPRIDIAELRRAGADLVVLPDEPYRFTASDGPEAFPGSRTALVSGRHLTWYGPSLTEAPAVLRRQLAAARFRSGSLL